MVAFLIRRLLFMILTMFLVSIIIFTIAELAPTNVAILKLGNTITPEQEQSFNAQNGLDQPVLTRYLRWMIGSDWQATSLIGMPVTRISDSGSGAYGWWAVGADDVLRRHYTPDGEQMIEIQLQPDNTTREVALGPEVWMPNPEGVPVFWGVDQGGRAAMWVRGDSLETWILTKAGWTSDPGAPRQYIPLQSGLLRGDVGNSLYSNDPVIDVMLPRLMNTLLLAFIAFVLIMPIALLLGLLAGLNEGRWIDRVLSVGGLVTTATPEFASGIFLILIFSLWLKLLPGSVVTTSGSGILDRPAMLVLPVLTLTLAEVGYVLRITRSSMVEVMRTNYIRTAVLKGLPRWRVVFRHALRNALMAPITVIILHINWLVGGIVVVETIFGYPGLGRYVLESTLNKDIFAVQAAAMVLVLIATGTQLVADLLYTYLNPRIRFA